MSHPGSAFGASPLAYHSDYQPHTPQYGWGAAVVEPPRTWHAGEHQEERVELFQMLEERRLRASNHSALGEQQPGSLGSSANSSTVATPTRPANAGNPVGGGGRARSESFSTNDIAAELFGGRFRGPNMSPLPNIALTTAATVAPVPTPAPIPQHTRTWHATEADDVRAALYGALEQRRQASATRPEQTTFATLTPYGLGADNPDGHAMAADLVRTTARDGALPSWDAGGQTAHGERPTTQPMSAVLRLESMFGPQR